MVGKYAILSSGYDGQNWIIVGKLVFMRRNLHPLLQRGEVGVHDMAILLVYNVQKCAGYLSMCASLDCLHHSIFVLYLSNLSSVASPFHAMSRYQRCSLCIFLPLPTSSKDYHFVFYCNASFSYIFCLARILCERDLVISSDLLQKAGRHASYCRVASKSN